MVNYLLALACVVAVRRGGGGGGGEKLTCLGRELRTKVGKPQPRTGERNGAPHSSHRHRRLLVAAQPPLPAIPYPDQRACAQANSGSHGSCIHHL